MVGTGAAGWRLSARRPSGCRPHACARRGVCAGPTRIRATSGRRHFLEGRHVAVRSLPRGARRGLILRTLAAEDDDGREIVEGYDIKKGGLLESELFATILKVGFVALCITVFIVLFNLAQPVVDTAVTAFPRAPT